MPVLEPPPGPSERVPATVLTDELCEVRCGWPVHRSAWQRLYCTLYLGHAGGRCRAEAPDGRVLVEVREHGEPAGHGRGAELRSRHG